MMNMTPLLNTIHGGLFTLFFSASRLFFPIQNQFPWNLHNGINIESYNFTFYQCAQIKARLFLKFTSDFEFMSVCVFGWNEIALTRTLQWVFMINWFNGRGKWKCFLIESRFETHTHSSTRYRNFATEYPIINLRRSKADVNATCSGESPLDAKHEENHRKFEENGLSSWKSEKRIKFSAQ